MQTSAAFFINPLSHTVAKQGSVLARCAADEAHIFTLNDFGDLPGYVDQALKAKCGLVCIEGGDGTIQGVLSAFLRRVDRLDALPRFVLLPGGMTNLVASNIGIKRPRPAHIRALMQNPAVAPKNEMPLLKLTTAGQTDLFGFLFSTGAFPAATQYCYDTVHTEGIGGAKAIRATIVRVLFGKGEVREKILCPTRMDLHLDADDIAGPHLLSLATTLPKLMVGMNPFWGEGDGPVRITRLDGQARRKTVNLAKMLKRKHSPASKAAFAKDGFRSWRTQNAQLDYDGQMVLDGEFIDNPPGPITLSATAPLTFLGRPV